jgi:hypothetical protein
MKFITLIGHSVVCVALAELFLVFSPNEVRAQNQPIAVHQGPTSQLALK